jgi:hypothetical protein
MERMMPLYEAKMIHHYDTRWATYQPDGSTRHMTEEEKAQRLLPLPRYWLHESEIARKLEDKWDHNWLLGWRDVCRATDARTVIATALPVVAHGDKTLLALPQRGRHELQAIWSSFALDFAARQKIGGTAMKYFTFMQLPIPAPNQVAVPGLKLDQPVDAWLGTRVDRLNAWIVSEAERARVRAELDALMFHVYGVGRDDVAYIMETFPIVKRKDEERHGEYRTKRLILAAYDAMAEAIATGQQYASPFEAVPA